MVLAQIAFDEARLGRVLASPRVLSITLLPDNTFYTPEGGGLLIRGERPGHGLKLG